MTDVTALVLAFPYRQKIVIQKNKVDKQLLYFQFIIYYFLSFPVSTVFTSFTISSSLYKSFKDVLALPLCIGFG